MIFGKVLRKFFRFLVVLMFVSESYDKYITTMEGIQKNENQ